MARKAVWHEDDDCAHYSWPSSYFPLGRWKLTCIILSWPETWRVVRGFELPARRPWAQSRPPADASADDWGVVAACHPRICWRIRMLSIPPFLEREIWSVLFPIPVDFFRLPLENSSRVLEKKLGRTQPAHPSAVPLPLPFPWTTRHCLPFQEDQLGNRICRAMFSRCVWVALY